DLPVHLVSAIGPDEALLTHWFEGEIAPMMNRHRALTEESIQRKIAQLREAVLAVLETLLAKQQGGQAGSISGTSVQEARRLLDEADQAAEHAKKRCRDWTLDEPRAGGDCCSGCGARHCFFRRQARFRTR